MIAGKLYITVPAYNFLWSRDDEVVSSELVHVVSNRWRGVSDACDTGMGQGTGTDSLER
jgi:hypothetical protein